MGHLDHLLSTTPTRPASKTNFAHDTAEKVLARVKDRDVFNLCYSNPHALRTVWVSLSDRTINLLNKEGLAISVGPQFLATKDYLRLMVDPLRGYAVYDLTLRQVAMVINQLWPRS